MEFRTIIKHPLMPLVNASISTVIFVWALAPYSTTWAVLMSVLAWVWSIRRVVRRTKARKAVEILLIAAILGSFGTVAITPEPVEAQSIGECSTSRAATFWGAVAGAVMGGVKGAIVGAAAGALASVECENEDWVHRTKRTGGAGGLSGAGRQRRMELPWRCRRYEHRGRLIRNFLPLL